MHGRARRGLGQLEASLADLRRGAELAERTGRERVLVILTIETVATLIELGRIADATAVAEEGVERARLAGNARILLWAQCARASARLAAGDVAAALQDAGEAAATGTQADFHAAGQPGWILGAALVAAGNPERGRDQLLDALPAVLPVDRPAATADLVEAHLACGDVDAAEQALAAPVLDIARSAVLLARGRPREAVDAARTAAAGPPLLAARARLAEGRALAAAGERDAAREALIDAESRFDGFGALRLRSEATRELRRLGHRVVRAATDGAAGPLTAREREIAELVAAGRTNREVAEQLVLSPRTIEAHVRNIYGKLGVRSRVELARSFDASGAPGNGSK